MSKKQQVYMVVPPLFPKNHPYEMETFDGFECSYCHGNGWYAALGDRNERVKEPCPVCQGSGRIKAVVTIKWMADEKKKSHVLPRTD